MRRCRPKPWRRRPAGRGGLTSSTSRIKECTQDREGQDFVPGVRGIVDLDRHIRLSRKRADPFAILVFEAAKFPIRYFELDQDECRIGPGLGLNQAVEAASLSRPCEQRDTRTDRHDVCEGIESHLWRKTKPLGQA